MNDNIIYTQNQGAWKKAVELEGHRIWFLDAETWCPCMEGQERQEKEVLQHFGCHQYSQHNNSQSTQ